MIRYDETEAILTEEIGEINAELRQPRILLAYKKACEEQKKTLQTRLTLLARRKHTHFDFIEDICAYMIMLSYNSTRPPTVHLSDPKHWRIALKVGPLTNAARNKPKQRTSPRPARAGDEAASSSAPQQSSKKRIRAQRYSLNPKGETPWPSDRLVGKHPLGRHPKGTKNMTCDLPGCCVGGSEAKAAKPAAAKSKAPVTPIHLSARPNLSSRGRGAGSSGQAPRDPSPASSEDSVRSNSGQVQMFCQCCYDPSGSRPMNFHFECYNIWHGLCDDCANDD